ncbi:MAG: hypothetical protein GWP09_00595 [Nitrospiraceae bacterium]|nr:hypothetical protein [Nitrospiraceae bacterium]
MKKIDRITKQKELKNNKKAQGLSLNMIVVGAIALIVLVVIIVLVIGYFHGWHPTHAVSPADCANLPSVNKISGVTCNWYPHKCGDFNQIDYTYVASDREDQDNSNENCCCTGKLENNKGSVTRSI